MPFGVLGARESRPHDRALSAPRHCLDAHSNDRKKAWRVPTEHLSRERQSWARKTQNRNVQICNLAVSGSNWEIANGGAKRIARFWGGGGKRTIECPFQNHYWRRQKVGFVWSVPFPPKKITWREQRGGRKRIICGGGGSKTVTVFEEGFLWCVFPPSPEFSTPPFVFL